MVGTRAHPNCKLTKEHLLSRAVGNKRKLKIAKQDASLLPTSSTLPSSSSPILVAGRPLPTTPPVTPVIDISGRPKGKPITRRDIPTCLDFGKFRRILYPSFMFCSPCDWWEQELYHRSQKTIKTANRSQKYLCKCQHSSFASPSSSSKKKYLCETTRPPLQVNPPLPTKYKEYDPTVLLQGSSGGKEESIIEDASVNNKVSGFTESTDHRKPSSAMQPNDQLHAHPANAFPDACPTSPMIVLAGAATILPCLLNSASPKASLAIHVEQELATKLLYDKTGSDGCEDEQEDHEPQSNQFEEAMVIEQPSFSAPILPREQEVVVEEISNENSMNDPSSLHLTPASDGVSFYEGECVRLMSALKIKDQRLAAANKKIARLEKKLLSNGKKGEVFKLKCLAKYVTRQVKLYIKRQSKRRDCKQNTVVANFFKSLMSVEDEEEEG